MTRYVALLLAAAAALTVLLVVALVGCGGPCGSGEVMGPCGCYTPGDGKCPPGYDPNTGRPYEDEVPRGNEDAGAAGAGDADLDGRG